MYVNLKMYSNYIRRLTAATQLDGHVMLSHFPRSTAPGNHFTGMNPCCSWYSFFLELISPVAKCQKLI